jgi:hypothetical protein
LSHPGVFREQCFEIARPEPSFARNGMGQAAGRGT